MPDMQTELTTMANRLNEQADAMGINDVIKMLNTLLANTASLYHEAHGFHWNVKGPDFSQYHALFGGIYESLFESIDDIAEWCLKLGVDAPFHMSEFIKLRTIGELSPEDTPQAMSLALLNGTQMLIDELKDAFEVAEEADEQGLANFIAELIDTNQKNAWQLRASLGLQKQNRI